MVEYTDKHPTGTYTEVGEHPVEDNPAPEDQEPMILSPSETVEVNHPPSSMPQAEASSSSEEVETMVPDEIVPVLSKVKLKNGPMPIPTSLTPIEGFSSAQPPASTHPRDRAAAIRGLDSHIRKFRRYRSGRRSSGSHSRGAASLGPKRPIPSGDSPQTPIQQDSLALWLFLGGKIPPAHLCRCLKHPHFNCPYRFLLRFLQ